MTPSALSLTRSCPSPDGMTSRARAGGSATPLENTQDIVGESHTIVEVREWRSGELKKALRETRAKVIRVMSDAQLAEVMEELPASPELRKAFTIRTDQRSIKEKLEGVFGAIRVLGPRSTAELRKQESAIRPAEETWQEVEVKPLSVEEKAGKLTRQLGNLRRELDRAKQQKRTMKVKLRSLDGMNDQNVEALLALQEEFGSTLQLEYADEKAKVLWMRKKLDLISKQSRAGDPMGTLRMQRQGALAGRHPSHEEIPRRKPAVPMARHPQSPPVPPPQPVVTAPAPTKRWWQFWKK